MKMQILQTAVLCLSLASANLAQQPQKLRLERADFFKEALSSNPSPRTLYYNTALEGSYQVAKRDIVQGLPEAAKAQGVNLRGLLAIGPYGSDRLVYVYTFTAEKSSIRVNQLTMAESRFTYKSTGKMTLAQYKAFWEAMVGARVLVPGLPADSQSEERYETVLAGWSNGKLDSYYGSTISPRPGANNAEFGKRIGNLLHSLNKTYPLLHGPATALPPRPKDTP